MQKNKNVQYLLLILVLGIWGSIAFQMCDFLEDNTVRIPTTQTLAILSNHSSERDSFTIAINYSDPFLGKQIQNFKTKKKRPIKRSKYQRPVPPSKTAAQPSVMPKIVYQGYAVNGHQISMVRIAIDKKIYTLKQMTQKKGITVLEMYKDSIIVGWKGERKTIVRSK